MDAEQYITEHWQPRKVWRHLYNRKHLRRLHRCADAMQGETFADVGCAFGHSTAIMAARHPGHWVGIDFSKTAIDQACATFRDSCQFWHYRDTQALADHGCGFGGVVCSEVIEHVEDDVALAEALKQITQKVLVLTTPCVPVGDPGHLRLYTREALAALFGGAEIDKKGPFWYVTWRPTS